MNPLEPFDDERLNADLAAILCLRAGEDTPSIDHRPRRGRTALKDALRSPHASATIGVSFFIAMLGTTAFLLYHPSGGQSGESVPRPSVRGPKPSKEASDAPLVATRIDDNKSPTVPAAGSSDGANHGSRHVRLAPVSRRKINPRQDDATIDVAATGGELGTPVVIESPGRPSDRGATDLAQITSPLPLQNVEVSADDRSVAPPVPGDAGAEDRSARIRRNSVAAIRALRRQW